MPNTFRESFPYAQDRYWNVHDGLLRPPKSKIDQEKERPQKETSCKPPEPKSQTRIYPVGVLVIWYLILGFSWSIFQVVLPPDRATHLQSTNRSGLQIDYLCCRHCQSSTETRSLYVAWICESRHSCWEYLGFNRWVKKSVHLANLRKYPSRMPWSCQIWWCSVQHLVYSLLDQWEILVLKRLIWWPEAQLTKGMRMCGKSSGVASIDGRIRSPTWIVQPVLFLHIQISWNHDSHRMGPETDYEQSWFNQHGDPKRLKVSSWQISQRPPYWPTRQLHFFRWDEFEQTKVSRC